jgi:hypothetical protein
MSDPKLGSPSVIIVSHQSVGSRMSIVNELSCQFIVIDKTKLDPVVGE